MSEPDPNLTPIVYWSEVIECIEQKRRTLPVKDITENPAVWAVLKRLADIENRAHQILSEEIARQERES